MNTNEVVRRMSSEEEIALTLRGLELIDPAFEKLVGFFRKSISTEGLCIVLTSKTDKKIVAPAAAVFATRGLYRTPYLGIGDHGKNAIRLDIGSHKEAIIAPNSGISYAIATKEGRGLDIYRGDFKFRPPDEYVRWLDASLRELEAMKIDRPINASTNPVETPGPTS